MPNSSRPTIGILGDGQLARFLALKAAQWDWPVKALSKAPESSPLKSIATLIPWENCQDSDKKAVRRLSDEADILLMENEWLNADALSYFLCDKNNIRLLPNNSAYIHLDSKLKQKILAQKLGIPTPEFRIISLSQNPHVSSAAQAPNNPEILNHLGNFLMTPQAINNLSYPLFVKAIRGGYDGKGNAIVHSSHEFEQLLSSWSDVLIEPILPIKKEVAVLALRHQSPTTQTLFWPMAETIQKEYVCRKVIVPSGLSNNEEQNLRQHCQKILDEINGEGLFAFEFFVTQDNNILLNEISPRPHNTGHWTIEGSNVSQYEALLRLSAGLPIPQPISLFPSVAMYNLFGPRSGNHLFLNELEQAIRTPYNIHHQIHLYGKTPRPGRKVGHITFWSDDVNQLRNFIENWELPDDLR